MEYLNSPYIVVIYFVNFSLNLRSISEVIMDWMCVPQKFMLKLLHPKKQYVEVGPLRSN